MTTPRQDLLGLNRDAMEAFYAGLGEKAFRASQTLKWIHQQGVVDFDAMTNLGKALRGRLAELAEVGLPQVVGDEISQDGTRKWLIRVDEDNCVETVFIPEDNRGTLCISSQVGCPLACTFCATGRQGLGRNLTAGEIIAQLWLARRLLAADGGDAITNVVLMGMGEPLLNFDNVVVAIDLMLDDFAYGLARRRVTLSTAGVVPVMGRLGARCPVCLAVSLHAPDDALRTRLVPLNRRYPIARVLDACRRYVQFNPKQQITFEYVLLDGINDSTEQAHGLVRLLRGLPAKVNLIPFNPFPGSPYRSSPAPVVEAFRNVLLAGGLMTITRKTRGADIAAACGQLAGRVRSRRRPSGVVSQPQATLAQPAA